MPPRKILVRGANWLGDAVMSTAALARLRSAYPQAHMTLLSPAALADLWRHQPCLDEVILFQPGENPWQVARRLHAKGFDWGLIFPNSPRSALELYLARVPRRIGYARPWRNWFLTDPVPPHPHEVRMRKRSAREIYRRNAGGELAAPGDYPARAHQVYRYLGLAAAAGAGDNFQAPHLVVTAQEAAEARRVYLPSNARDVRWLGLNAGAAYGRAKRWPADRFSQAAAAIHRQTGCGCLVFGVANQADTTAELLRGLRRASVAHIVDLTGKTGLRELCALLSACDAVLTNDTGPMHLAAALGRPVVALFGSTAPELTGPAVPGQPGAGAHVLLRAPVPCAPCFRRECPIDLRCLEGIPASSAIAAVLDVLGRKSSVANPVSQAGR